MAETGKSESFGESIGMQPAMDSMKTPEMDEAVEHLIGLCMTTGADAFKQFARDPMMEDATGWALSMGALRLGMTIESMKAALDELCRRIADHDADMASEIRDEYLGEGHNDGEVD